MPILIVLPHLKTIVIEDQNEQDIWPYMEDRYGLSDMELAQNVCRKLQKQKDLFRHVDILVQARFETEESPEVSHDSHSL